MKWQNSLSLRETDELQVITCRLIPKNNTGNFTDEQRRELAIVEKEILKFLPQDYVSSNINQLIYIQKENEKEGKLEFRKKVEEVQQRIQKYLVKKERIWTSWLAWEKVLQDIII